MMRRIFPLVVIIGAILLPTQIFGQEAVQQGKISATEAASATDTAAEARPPVIPVAHFAQNNQLSGARLSPDGKNMVIKVEVQGKPFIVVIDPSTQTVITKFGVGEKVDLEWFRWAGNDRILFSVSSLGEFFGEETRFTRLYVVNFVADTAAYIGRKENVVQGDDVIYVADDGSYALVSMQKTPYDYPSVFRFELKDDGDVSVVQRPREGVWNWYADNDGVVRLGTGWLRKRLRVHYRSGPDEDIKLIARLREDDEEERFWDISQIVSGSDEGYVLQEGDNGRVGIRRFNYATREVVDTFYENPDWDIDSVTLRDGVPVAAYYTDDRDRAVWFEDGRKREYAALEKTLKEDEVWITSRAEDGSRMLVWAGGEADPGALYIYTPGERRLDQFAEYRPSLDFTQLARPKPVTYSARDGTEIRAYQTLPRGREAKNLPLILLPHGGPYGVRDRLDYDDDVQLLANRGYAVLQPNYRGSDGYGKAFTELGTGQIGRAMQDDIDDAMDWAVKQGIADANRVCVVGGSYGGYAAIWAVIRNPERYRCAASWAGVTDWDSQLKYDANYFSRKGGKRWRERVEGDGDGEFNLDQVSPVELGKTLGRPLLLAHGKDDSNVPFSQFKKMRDASKNAPMPPELLEIADEGHSFSKPDNKKVWYEHLIAFLAKHNPAE
ncbi:MAG: prolyl oligopeptidase family serine peptidase [Pontixanthobacter sp.]